MRTEEPPNSEPQAHVGVFATTHWSVVLAAGEKNTPQSAEALERLCRTYWYPLYAYILRQGRSSEDAQDLTQEFLRRLLERNSFAEAAHEKGRFRSFLLGALKHFLADEQDKSAAKKRGGGRTIISWEEVSAEERFSAEPADELSPDKLFDRRWALTLLEKAIARLRTQYQAQGSLELFEALSCYLTEEGVTILRGNRLHARPERDGCRLGDFSPAAMLLCLRAGGSRPDGGRSSRDQGRGSPLDGHVQRTGRKVLAPFPK